MKKKLLLFLVPLLIVYVWFQHGGMLAGTEEGLPFYSAAKTWSLASSMWRPIETGDFAIDLYPRINLAWIFVVASNIHIPTFVFQASLFYLLMVVGMYSMYCLIRYFLKSHAERDTIALIGGLFYLLNPYSMTQVWQRGLYAQYFMFALLPLASYLFALGLEKKKFLFVYLVALSSFVFSTTFGLVTNIIVFWSVIFFYFCWWVLVRKNSKDRVWGSIYFILNLIFWALVNAWWFVPLVLFKQDIFGGKAGDASGNIASLKEVSQYFPFPSVIRLIQNYYFFHPGMYGIVYSHIRLQTISWILPLCAIIGMLAIRKTRSTLFFVLLFFLALFISLGSNLPLGWLFTLLFKDISILQAFRNPYEKYGIVFMLAYTPLFAYGLYLVSKVIQECLYRFVKLPIILVSLTILTFTGGIYLWPMWQGLYKTPVRVPSEYADVNSWLAQHEKDRSTRIFVIPFQGETVTTDWNFDGLDPAIFTFNQPSYSLIFQTPYTFDMSHNLHNYMGQINEYPILSLLGAKYVVTRADLVNADQNQLEAINTVRDPNYSEVTDEFCSALKSEGSVSCPFPQSLIDQLQNKLESMYVDIVVKTDLPSDLSFQLKNHGSILAEWADNGNIEYETQKNVSKELLLPINEIIPSTQDISTFSPQLFIQAESLNSHITPRVAITNVKLIPFTTQPIQEDTVVFKKGKLAVYKIDTNQFQPAITTLSSIKEEPTFRDFFTQAGEDRNALTGYIVTGQNAKKQLNRFMNSTSNGKVQSKQISSTRYFVKRNPENETVLAFNQTFSPQWKIISVKTPDDLNYSFINDIKLIRSAFLPESDHVVGNGYDNFWLLPKGGKTFGIIFLPQIYADVAGYISAGTVGLLLIYFTVYLTQMNRNKK